MPTSCPPLLDASHIAFMQGGVSISIGGCSADGIPSVCKGLGCRVHPDLRQVTLFVPASHAPELLVDLAHSGAIAAVFSQPSTNRTLQLKGSDARMAATEAGDLAIVEDYRDAFVRELQPLGYEAHLIRTLLACPAEDIVRIDFTPAAAFTQTPGPHAGQPLREPA